MLILGCSAWCLLALLYLVVLLLVARGALRGVCFLYGIGLVCLCVFAGC